MNLAPSPLQSGTHLDRSTEEVEGSEFQASLIYTEFQDSQLHSITLSQNNKEKETLRRL